MPAPIPQLNKVGFSHRKAVQVQRLHGTTKPTVKELTVAGFSKHQRDTLLKTVPAVPAGAAAVLPSLEVLIKEGKFTRAQAQLIRQP